MQKVPVVKVIDIRNFSSVDEMFESHHSIWPPRIFLVSDADEELQVLEKITSLDDVCLIKNIDVQLDRRIQLVEIRASILSQLKNQNEDPLTGLKYRQVMEEDFKHLISGMKPHDLCSLILVDLDFFKAVNDKYGHNFGDTVLKQVGHILKDAHIDSMVYRYGGEEFAILYRSNMEQSMAFADYLREVIAETGITFQGEKVFITASFGVATGNGTADLTMLLKEADRYLYQAKELGRNRVVGAIDFNSIVHTSNELPEVVDFENRMKVATQRLMKYMSIRYRSSVKQIQIDRDIDGLTGVYVRRYFDERFKREFQNAKKNNKKLSILFIDLDNFGSVNKTYGFANGDRVLKSSTGVFKKSIRLVDWIGRYGGEEFCIVLPDTSLDNAIEVANRILSELRSTVVLDETGGAIIVTGSIGVGELMSGEVEESFIHRVSNYTLEAKKRGKDQIFYE